MAVVGVLNAQDTIRTLIISEARIDNQHNAYLELTNVGTDTLDLSNFEVARCGAWTKPWGYDGESARTMLPAKKLAPGKSFVIAKLSDYTTKMWALKPDLFDRYQDKVELRTLADMEINTPDAPTQPNPLDSVSKANQLLTCWGGRDAFYVRYHFLNSLSQPDSAVVDQVGGVFDESDGTNYAQAYKVAGVDGATGNSTLVRKFSVKKGNIDFATGRGMNSLDESEWIPIPFQLGAWEPERALFWTVKNHGDYHLSDLVSSTVTVDKVNKTITVPWGTRDDDAIMNEFTKVPGIAWHYSYSTAKNIDNDSAYVSARTGDKLILYACGNTLDVDTFSIIAEPSKPGDALVIPKKVPNYPVVPGKNVSATKSNYVNSGAFCDVTEGLAMDSIISHDEKGFFVVGTRVDTLLKYLEIPTGATVSIKFVDNVVRPDLKVGDILTVKSADGTNSKDYYIRPHSYYPSHDGYLASVTWPDIPDSYKDLYGWIGDTIPGWLSSKFAYQVHVPFDVDGIPALVGKKEQVNSKLTVQRALNLTGSVSDRSVVFTNVAEDDTTIKVYNVELIKDVDPSLVQPWAGDPFISQYIFKQNYSNWFAEIVNPGTDVLDLSNYLIAGAYFNTTSEGITRVAGTTDWANRYNKYIFGYKWQDQTAWGLAPALAEQDANITPYIVAGDVFVLAYTSPGDRDGKGTGPALSVIKAIDLDFNNNPWGDDLTAWGSTVLNQWLGGKLILYKITNDSIKAGTKAVSDPRDFKVIDALGMADNSNWKIGGKNLDQVQEWFRKPEIYKGNPVIGASFGGISQNSDTCEWTCKDEGWYQAHGYGWPTWRIMVADGIGTHFMNTATQYKSTVSSNVYLVSKGYSMTETLKGVGNDVANSAFQANVIKADPGQHLKVVAVADGSVLADGAIISAGDTLVVVSKDSTNTSKYIIDVTPLSSDAVLTSATYTIDHSGTTGSVSNVAYGTLLKDVVSGLTVPAGATMIVADGNGAYQALKTLQYDSTYVDVKVNDKIQFVVVAEDGVTKITYNLIPTASASDAFVTSDMFMVDNNVSLISKIPTGTNVSALMSNLIPVTGASMKLYDKNDNERTFGNVAIDDKLIVTSADGNVTKTYYLAFIVNDGKYLCYVLSNTYTVTSLDTLKISDATISEWITVNTLVSNLIPAPYATIQVLDASNNVKSGTDNLTVGDVVEVTSGNGVFKKNYKLVLNTSVPVAPANVASISVGPNPALANTAVIVKGIDVNSKISVYNVIGDLVQEKIATSSPETITLRQEGVYIVKVSSKGKKDETFKLIVK
jgi:hypothetical protein